MEVPTDLITRFAALFTLWFLLPDHLREFMARKVVLCIGFWRYSSKKHSNKSKRQRQRQRHVSFGQLEILEFPSLLGDNPSVKQGVPLTMDWKPIHRSIQLVDLVPEKRWHRKPRVLTPTERELLLLAKGYSIAELEKAWVNNNHNHNQQNPSGTPFANLRNKVRNLVGRRECT